MTLHQSHYFNFHEKIKYEHVIQRVHSGLIFKLDSEIANRDIQ